MSLQANQYLVYLGRDDEKHVSAGFTTTIIISRIGHRVHHLSADRIRPVSRRTFRNKCPTPHHWHSRHHDLSFNYLRRPHRLTLNDHVKRRARHPLDYSHIQQVDHSMRILGRTSLFRRSATTNPSTSRHRPLVRYHRIASRRHRPFMNYPMTPSTGLSHFTQNIPPRVPPRPHRTSKPSPTIEQDVPLLSARPKPTTNTLPRRPPPPPPVSQPEPPQQTPRSSSHKTRFSRKCSRSNSTLEVQQRAASAIGSRPSTSTATTVKRGPLKRRNIFSNARCQLIAWVANVGFIISPIRRPSTMVSEDRLAAHSPLHSSSDQTTHIVAQSLAAGFQPLQCHVEIIECNKIRHRASSRRYCSVVSG